MLVLHQQFVSFKFYARSLRCWNSMGYLALNLSDFLSNISIPLNKLDNSQRPSRTEKKFLLTTRTKGNIRKNNTLPFLSKQYGHWTTFLHLSKTFLWIFFRCCVVIPSFWRDLMNIRLSSPFKSTLLQVWNTEKGKPFNDQRKFHIKNSTIFQFLHIASFR